MTSMVIEHANIVTPDVVIVDGTLVVENGTIIEISRSAGHSNFHGKIDAQGKWLLPGLIDTHSDAIEKEMQPRPNSIFPLEPSFFELERKVVSQGITTMHHALSLNGEDSEHMMRRNGKVEQIIYTIQDIYAQRKLMDHKIHLRLDMSNIEAITLTERLIMEGLVDQISFNDHTPGQGQFKNEELLIKYYMEKNGLSREESYRLLNKRLQRTKLGLPQLIHIAEIAKQHHIPIASHDDDSIEKLDMMEKCHVNICEFPIELEVAKEAKRRGMLVVMGGPNVILGKSHSNNLSARKAVEEGVVDILCTDYYPPSLIQAVFMLYKQGMDMETVVNMVSINPARALHIDRFKGSLEVGKDADLLIVSEFRDKPVIEQVFVQGHSVCHVSYQEGIPQNVSS